MTHDALICRHGPHGWRWCVVPSDLVEPFKAHGWIVILSSDEMWNSETIAEVRQLDEDRPIHRPRNRRFWSNGD